MEQRAHVIFFFSPLILQRDPPDYEYPQDIIEVSKAFRSYYYELHAVVIDRNTHVCLALPVWLV